MKNYSKREICLVYLDSFLGLEYKHKRNLCDLVERDYTVSELIKNAKDYLLSNLGENEYNTILESAKDVYVDYLFDNLTKNGVSVTTVFSKDYPKSLLKTDCPPLVLYYKGDINLLNSELFAIVGSRKSLPSALSLCERYVKELVEVGFVPVTGIAEGVDAKVLSTALSVKAKAISVIAGGLNHVYPKAHCELIDKVAKNGLVLSEYPPETIPKPFHFPVRNRIIAGLSKGVLIVSGAIKSGTLYTAEYAEEYGKDLFAVPYGVGVLSGAGCNDLIKRGAMLTDTPKDIIDFYGKSAPKKQVQLTDSEREIIRALKDGQLHVEKICTLLNKQVFEITPILFILEIKGIISKSGNVFGLIRNDLEE